MHVQSILAILPYAIYLSSLPTQQEWSKKLLFLLLRQDNIGVFVDQNGKHLQAEKICWSEAPSLVVIQKSYAISLLPRRIEVA
jgi:hypothetical protein